MCFIAAIILAFNVITFAGDVNLALGKPYTLSQKPNGEDAGDQTDLTDGVNFRSASMMWEAKGSVGWYRVKVPVHITVDLGRDEPIRGVSFSTGGGSGGVGYPSSVVLSVSTDDRTYHYVGDLLEMTKDAIPEYGRTTAHRIIADPLKTHGRYVRFSAVSSTMFLFCDEVEVYRGDEAWLQQPLDGKGVSDKLVMDPLRLTQIGVNRRVKDDWAMVRNAVENGARGNVRTELLQKLDGLWERIVKADGPQSLAGFRAVIPVSSLDASIFAVRGELLAANGAKPLTLWHGEPYQLLELLQPIDTQLMSSLKVRMLGNDRRAEVFNLTNATTEAQTVPFTIDGMPNGTVHVYQVEYVDTRENLAVADALMPLQGERGQYTTIVPAGMTRQIWLSFDSTTAAAGRYQGWIHLPSLDQQVPLMLDIASVSLPKQSALDVTMWDSVFNKGYAITPENQAAVKVDLINHCINGVWGTRDTIPLPTRRDFDDAGNLIGTLNYDKWDDFVKYWPEARYYFTFAAYTDLSDLFAEMKLGTPQCDHALAQWAADWARHNRQLGLKTGQAAICFIDEPRTAAGYHASYQFIKPFSTGTDEILTMTNPLNIDNSERLQEARPLLEAADIIVPLRTGYESADKMVQTAYRQLQRQGKRLWFYSCSGPTRQYDPAYYRMQPWHCFAADATGQGFWSYDDTGGADSWNPYTAVGQTAYSPGYISADSVHTSKHWEAMREGVCDYGYLVLLAARDGNAAARNAAQSTISELIKTYGNYYFIDWKDSTAIAEESRLTILDRLAR
jgi:hypothetical protein